MWAETIATSQSVAGGIVQSSLIQGAAKCNHCGRASLGTSTSHRTTANGAVSDFERTADSTVTWFPSRGSAPEFPDVPSHIAVAAKEAHASASINALMAAILMARTVVEATAKEKGILKGMLVNKIDELAKQQFIRESTREAAHEIRHLETTWRTATFWTCPMPRMQPRCYR